MDEPSALSRLPKVDLLLQRDDAAAAIARYGRGPVTDAVRRALDDIRTEVRAGRPLPPPDEVVTRAVADVAGARAGRLRRVVNATGVVLHTNLGRAPLSAAAREAAVEAAGYTTLEYDLGEGARGSRTAHVGRLAAELCGTEAATVVNNGAAALVLVLAALSTGREALVSRGELIEIGGSYRLPDVMAVSGALMREVGTTNRTRVADYRDAVGDDTGLLLKVHRSNFEVVGFVEEAGAGELAALGRDAGVPFVHDLGSGLIRTANDGPFAGEPSVEASVAAGADLVIFSGDKLLGGPQAGIVAGRADLVRRCTTHPLARAFRIDKLQRAALEATLEAHLRADVPTDVPTWAMLTADPASLRARAEQLAPLIGDVATAAPTRSVVGGGSLPGVELDSWGITIGRADVDGLADDLRAGDPPVIGRVDDGRLVLDLRTVPPADDDLLVDLVRAALGDTAARERDGGAASGDVQRAEDATA
ncbi:MAG: L-seryl-tRNA(Sec) selenium transferase [Actinobacteria bacterium]|nr:L-seryl-tRNA(Sec) selenium transferase [Actinomycetota bacterium]